MRYFIQLSYKGTAFHGWQIQPNALSVQEVLNNALTTILNTKIDTTGAGRTDSGVHAKQMFAHFDYENLENPSSYISKLNSYLPKDIAVQNLYVVHPEAHARFDATQRTYQYFINNQKNPFLQDSSWFYAQSLDVNAMNSAAALLLEHTNFQCFSKVNTEVATFDCRVYEAFWKTNSNQLQFTISADRFLRNMVRAIVGTLIKVGLHKITLSEFNAIIESKDRSEAGFSVPAHGLHLTQINYPYLTPIITE